MITGICRFCGSPVYWLTNPKTGKKSPIDIEEGWSGTVTIDLNKEEYSILPKGSPVGSDRHRLHRLTCKK